MFVRSWLSCVFFTGGVTIGNIGRQLASVSIKRLQYGRQLSCIMRNQRFVYQRLCFRYTDSTISRFFFNPKVHTSSCFLRLYRPICVGPVRKPRRPFKLFLMSRLKYNRHQKKVQVGKDQEMAQSEKDSHSKNRGGKKPNQQSGTYTMKHIVSRMSSYFPNRWPLSYLNLTKNMKTYIRRQQHKKFFKHQDIKRKEPPQKYRLGTISNTKLLAGLNRFYMAITSPSASAVVHHI